MAPRLSLHLLGPFRATLDGEPVTGFESNKARALLAYLAVEADRAHSRDALAGLLWPENPDANALANLRFALSSLRRTIGDRSSDPPFLLITRRSIQLNPAGDCRLDATAFAAAVAACENGPRDAFLPADLPVALLQQAADLHGGSFLEGFYVSGAPAFDEWLTLRREQIEQQALGVLRRLADCRERRGEYEEVEHCARRQLALDPWREAAHRQLMRALARQGRRSAALAQYQSCRRVLAEELDLQPAPETESLCARIRAAGEARPHNLPPLGERPFVGRREEMGLVRQALADPRRRLLTLVGPGGIGKTCLALRIARSAATDRLGPFLHGVYFVPLIAADTAGISTSTLASTIARSLSLPLSGPDSPSRQLLDALCERECLVLVDSGECLDEQDRACIAGLLQQAKGVQFLVTSRERLGLSEEWVLEIDGLPFPAEQARQQYAGRPAGGGPDLQSHDAVRLLVERARQACAAFSLDDRSPAEQAAVARITQLAQGMPLAIELAAAWVHTLSCHEIAGGIEESLDLLATTAPDRPSRHRSIRAAFEYSWRMLPPTEQHALTRLSVFCGSFGRRAAGQVAGATLEMLAALRARSLLQRVGSDDEARYQLHPLLRQFAQEKMEEEQREETRARHAGYYGRFLHERREQLEGPRLPRALREIEADIENVRAGWDWAVDHNRPELVGRYAPGLYDHHAMRGWHHEGRDAFGRAVAMARETIALPDAGPEQALLLAGLLSRLAEFERELGALDRAQALLEESRAIGHRVEEPGELALTYEKLGFVAYRRGNYARATELLDSSLQIARDAGHRHHTAHVLMVLGAVARDLGEQERARECFRESADVYRALEYQWGIAHALRLLAAATHVLGDRPQARAYRRESLALCRKLNDHIGEALLCRDLGQAARDDEQNDRAEELYREGLALLEKEDDARALALVLESLASLLLDLERTGEAQAHLRAGFETAAGVHDAPLILRIIVGIARLLVQSTTEESSRICTAELLDVVCHHPASTPPLRAEAAQLRGRLAVPQPASAPSHTRPFREIEQIVYSVLERPAMRSSGDGSAARAGDQLVDHALAEAKARE
jgi:DNA-binding SARP family transcriptional activator/predicted ATPase/uncharacterized protein HemY